MRSRSPSRETGRIGVLRIVIWIALIGVLCALSLPGSGSQLVKGRMTQTLSNLKQLHMASQQMTLDNQTTGDSPIRWTCSGTTPLTFEQWTNALVTGKYVTAGELKKFLSFGTRLSPTNVVSVFAVAEKDPADTVLLATKNWQGPGVSDLAKNLYSGPGVVIFRKGGDGVILQPRQATATNLIGTGGMHNFLPLR